MDIQNRKIQKVTAYIPKDLLVYAQKATHKGVTETIKIGLKKIVIEEAYKNMSQLGGKYKIDFDMTESRKDKDYNLK